MSDISTLLLDLRRDEVQLWVDDGSLCYKAPRGVLSTARLAELRAHKTDLVSFLERASSIRMGATAPQLLSRERPKSLPLSFAQERLWLLEQIGGLGPSYNMTGAVRLRGLLDVVALERSLAAIVERHEVLRTRFGIGDGSPVQVIDPPGGFGLQVVDLSGSPDGELAALARQRLKALALAPFDLERGPLFRAHLLRISETDHVLLTVIHHVSCDGWSIGVLLREIGTLYAAYVEGRPSPLPALPVQYADYALWQRGWLQGEVLSRQVAYWKSHLAGAPAVLDLPTDRPRPAVQSYRGAGLSLELPADLTGKLQALAMSEGATLFMVLLAAFNVVLSRWSGQDDIVVGSPIAGRTHRDLEGLIGLFVNTLALRTDLAGDPSFRGLLRRVKSTALGAYAHQDLPFEKLVAEMQPVRDLSRHPVFQAMLALQNMPQETQQFLGLESSHVGGDTITSKLDLSLYVYERADHLLGYFEYATDLFDPASIKRLAGHLQVLLERAVDAPDARLSELQMLSKAERRQLVEDWNATSVEVPGESCLHHLFMEQAAKTPGSIAIVCDEAELSYGELDRRSNRLAHHLRSLGVSSESIVGLCMERSVELVVGLLGILKAGGAYLPLDPDYPLNRLSYMLADAGASIVVTQASVEARLGEIATCRVRLDADREAIDRQADVAPSSSIHPGNLLYVIYTSGSTGKPKGVMGTHGSVVNRLHWDATDSSGEEIYVQKTTPNFIDALWEVFMPLIRGQRLVVASDAASRDPVRLVELLSRSKANRIVVVPSLMRALLEVEDIGARLADLRYWACSGEELDPELAKLFCARLPDARLFNVYGTSEFWDATFHKLDPATGNNHVPIGRPISNMQVYLLDRHGEPVPVGIAGELHVGGAGLARGYLNRAGLTADRFAPSPFGDGERLYRTGDRALWRPDGTLEYLGRIDHQVKLRGYRIELGEIEARLADHPNVGQAVVVVRADDTRGQRLVAYYTVQAGSSQAAIEAAVLRSHAMATLPSYMVPSAFVRLEALPLFPNGKVDRAALPAPESDAYSQRQYMAPRNATEEIVCDIWCEVLGLDRVGVHDNFFELGGHSLLAMRVVTRIRERLGIELPLRTFFETSTLADMAATADLVRREDQQLVAPPLRARSRDRSLPLSFGQERMWLLQQIEELGGTYHLSAVVRIKGDLNVGALEQALSSLIERHEILRTRIDTVDGLGVQLIDPFAPISLVVDDLRQLATAERIEHSVGQIVSAELSRRFELSKEPAFRARLVRVAADDYVLMVVTHHVASDGWSMGILLREIGLLYGAFVAGAPSSLPDLPVQYADYALWQRDWLQGERLERQLDYWSARLAGAAPALDLPTDRPRPPMQSFRGSRVPIKISAGLTAKLRTLARSEGATLFMVLLAAFNVILSRWSGQRDIVVGSPIAGRGDQATEGLIGLFVNMLALRTTVTGRESFRDLFGEVRENSIAAYAHQDLPFERLVEELRPARDLSRHPVFQVLFVLQNVPHEQVEMPGVDASQIDVRDVTAKLDLSLYLYEKDDALAGYFEYATDLFDAKTIQRLVDWTTRLLEGICENPDADVAALPLLSDDEYDSLVEGCNDTAAGYPHQICLHELIAEQAARTPDAIALSFEGTELSYAELDRRSNQLSHYLRKLGIGPEVLVGLCVERSPNMIVGLLGILKAGGAYVPLDPSNPPERIAFMVRDAGVKTVVTQAALVKQLPDEDVQFVRIDTDWEKIDQCSHDHLEHKATAENLAYVIYTSGSTGKPKGVMIQHRSVVNVLFAMMQKPGFTKDDVMVAITRFSFDMSIPELYLPLVVGATVALQSREVASSGTKLSAELARLGATVLHATPSSWRLLLEAGWKPSQSLRMWCGAEGLPEDLASSLTASGEEVWNLYGPTETTVWSTAGSIPPDSRVHVGRPLANTQVYILDPEGRLAPTGAPGELHIGGAGLARGYLGRRGLTAEKFVPSSYGAPGERLYRTGDIARWGADGELEYLGRVDHQVKVRGYRIELGEIEAALVEYPEVRQAVVITSEAAAGDKRLVAYIAAPGPIEASELRRHLKQSLPGYMVPSTYIRLDALPLTPNGKIDRAALPAPEHDAVIPEEHVAPRTPAEELLSSIWCEVLRLERVGAYHNFFEIGGHSLIAMRVVARIREVFKIELPLRALFEAPTIVGLAERIVRAQRAATIMQKEIGEIFDDLEGMSEEEAEKLVSSLVEGGNEY